MMARTLQTDSLKCTFGYQFSELSIGYLLKVILPICYIKVQILWIKIGILFACRIDAKRLAYKCLRVYSCLTV